MQPILRVDVGGIPADWITYEEAVKHYATDEIAWTHGDPIMEYRGGINSLTGLQSKIVLHPIIAVAAKSGAMRSVERRLTSVPPLGQQSLFKRDRYTCAYCGDVHPGNHKKLLTRDHILAQSKGGPDAWMNVVTACKSCNHRKGDQTLGPKWKLLYAPYVPDLYEGLLLKGRQVLACHHEFLSSNLPKHSRLM